MEFHSQEPAIHFNCDNCQGWKPKTSQFFITEATRPSVKILFEFCNHFYLWAGDKCHMQQKHANFHQLHSSTKFLLKIALNVLCDWSLIWFLRRDRMFGSKFWRSSWSRSWGRRPWRSRWDSSCSRRGRQWSWARLRDVLRRSKLHKRRMQLGQRGRWALLRSWTWPRIRLRDSSR